MKKLYLLYSLCWAIALTACQNADTSNDQPKFSKAQILASIESFNHAFAKGDIDHLSTSITENYQHSNGTSKAIGKESWLNYLKSRKAQLESGELKVLEYRLEETQLETFGHTAILTAKIISKTELKGETRENEYRVTHVWAYENGKWKRAAFHDGKIQ